MLNYNSIDVGLVALNTCLPACNRIILVTTIIAFPVKLVVESEIRE